MNKKIIILVGCSTLIAMGIIIFFFIRKSPEDQAEEAIETFYSYEQEGNFADSWNMFHPLMQEKLAKVEYLQDRPHVFMDDFGVDSFEYTVEDVEQVTDWQMEEEAEPIDVVYEGTVSQEFKGKYGNFTLVQGVFAVEIDGEWKIMWDYNT